MECSPISFVRSPSSSAETHQDPDLRQVRHKVGLRIWVTQRFSAAVSHSKVGAALAAEVKRLSRQHHRRRGDDISAGKLTGYRSLTGCAQSRVENFGWRSASALR